MHGPSIAPPLSVPPAASAAPDGDGIPARRWVPLTLIVWAAIYAILIAMNLGGLSHGEFHDPDDQLRLQQVRDLLAGQSWFDLHQYRIAAADGGVLMHWSRLVDIPIAAVMLLARPVLGGPGAELAALVVVPALTLLAICLLIGWIGVRVLPRTALPVALLVTAFAAPVIVQVLPARIDHHGWQIALALLAMAALLVRDPRRGGWLAGAALAGWMAISFEGLPFSAWFMAVLGAAALVDPRLRIRLVSAMQALAVVSAALFLATRGFADLALHCDAIAPIHLAVFAWGALAISGAHYVRPQSRAALLAGLGAAAAGALVLVLSAAPQCASGTFDMLDPVVRDFWLEKVQEGKPITRSPWHLIFQFTLPPAIGVVAALLLARRTEGDRRQWWLLYAALLAGALAIGIAVSRAAAISGALAVLPLGWWLSLRLTSLKRPSNPLLRVGELVGVAALIFATVLPVVPVAAVEKLLEPKDDADGREEMVRMACHTNLAGAAIDALPEDGILAPMDLGPDILTNTHKSVLATGHHRGARGMRLTIDAFSGTPEQARAIMAEKKLRYLLICPKLPENALYLERAPKGFAAVLHRGAAPDWLVPVAMPAASELKVWRRLD